MPLDRFVLHKINKSIVKQKTPQMRRRHNLGYLLLHNGVPLQIQQLGVYGLYNKGVGPKTGLDVNLGVSDRIFGGNGDLQVAAISAHAHGRVDGVSTEFDRQTQQLFVADVAVGLTINVKAKAASDAVRGALTVDINAAFFGNAEGTAAFGAGVIYRVDIVGFATVWAFDSDFCRHMEPSVFYLVVFILPWIVF